MSRLSLYEWAMSWIFSIESRYVRRATSSMPSIPARTAKHSCIRFCAAERDTFTLKKEHIQRIFALRYWVIILYRSLITLSISRVIWSKSSCRKLSNSLFVSSSIQVNRIWSLYLWMIELSNAHGLSNFDTAVSKQAAKFGKHSSVCFNAITFPIEVREILGVITFGITTSCA